MATECSNRNHSAAFPEQLPAWFIRLFTLEDDVVLDPFVGSGTTAVAAKKLKRRFIGIDTSQKYFDLANERLKSIQSPLFNLAEPSENYDLKGEEES